MFYICVLIFDLEVGVVIVVRVFGCLDIKEILGFRGGYICRMVLGFLDFRSLSFLVELMNRDVV